MLEGGGKDFLHARSLGGPCCIWTLGASRGAGREAQQRQKGEEAKETKGEKEKRTAASLAECQSCCAIDRKRPLA